MHHCEVIFNNRVGLGQGRSGGGVENGRNDGEKKNKEGKMEERIEGERKKEKRRKGREGTEEITSGGEGIGS